MVRLSPGGAAGNGGRNHQVGPVQIGDAYLGDFLKEVRQQQDG